MIQPPEGSPTFALQFGDMRNLLERLEMGSQASIASRFRKLRPKFASDNLLSKRGNWVEYDLTRILSICTVYFVNSTAIPQGDAVPIVIHNWPEIARACLAANRAMEAGDAAGVEAVVRIYVDAFPFNDAAPSSWSTGAEASLTGVPHIVLDCRPIVGALRAMFADDRRLQPAFDEIDRTFGWEKLGQNDAPRHPFRLESGFFGTGPYFERARSLLSVADPGFLRTRERLRLQAHLDYLEAPPPIDAWKQFIGTDSGKPRLHHMLSAWGLELGLKSTRLASEVLRATTFPSNERALDLIERGERYLAGVAAEGAIQ